MVKTYCLKCTKEIKNTDKHCECGSEKFVTGELKIKNNKFTCVCGSSTFNLLYHADAKNYFLNVMRCTECGESVELKTLRDKGSKLYWE
ncbi:hypothetical protein ABG79_02157 [Caloramator mitchellensis]|uniref:Uncharacterized protein n=1 Tax=Caloramator mitchellensis TaxID=908809 RepID=A0A0R3JRG4_CALMK|nr:hypothetical protein [Caloramator mitchellensis]KRQ86025.1 hypothetical protein ABG79_02157 [Caloramator mitchellensis]